jgi:hypothetical protein
LNLICIRIKCKQVVNTRHFNKVLLEKQAYLLQLLLACCWQRSST